MKNILRSIAVLLLSIASSSYTMGDKSGFDTGMGIGFSAPNISVPRLGEQPEEQQAEHKSRQLARFEQGIVKKAVEKLEKIFNEQTAREANFNFFMLPFEIQVQVFAHLTQAELERLARLSTSMMNVVNSYRQQATVLDLSSEPNITLKLLLAVSKLYPNLKKIIIYNPKIKTRFTLSLILALTKYFPKLEYIKLLDHLTSIYEDRSLQVQELYLWKNPMPDWTNQALNRMVEYIQVNPAGELHHIDVDREIHRSFDCCVTFSNLVGSF